MRDFFKKSFVFTCVKCFLTNSRYYDRDPATALDHSKNQEGYADFLKNRPDVWAVGHFQCTYPAQQPTVIKRVSKNVFISHINGLSVIIITTLAEKNDSETFNFRMKMPNSQSLTAGVKLYYIEGFTTEFIPYF